MKNPWMSAYLSAANQIASANRGLAAAEISRQQSQMMAAGMELWMRMACPWLMLDGRKR